MNLNNLHFYERSNRYGTELGMRVRGYWVQKSTFEQAAKLIEQNQHLLTWEKPLESRDICRHPDWDTWLVSLRHNIGRCVRYFSEDGMLPLWIVNPEKGGPRRYMPK